MNRLAVVVVALLWLGPAPVLRADPVPSPPPVATAVADPLPEVHAPPPPEPIESLVALPSAAEMLMPFIKTMLMLGVVLALVWLTLHKGMGKLVEKAQAGKRVRVVERISLDARRSLFLVEVDGKQMILAGGDVVRISEVESLAALPKSERHGLFDKVLSATQKRPKPASTSTTQPTETEQAS